MIHGEDGNDKIKTRNPFESSSLYLPLVLLIVLLTATWNL